MPVPGGSIQRRVPRLGIAGVHRRALGDEQRRCPGEALFGRRVESGRARVVMGMDVGAMANNSAAISR
jgi:hypothetical protein